LPNAAISGGIAQSGANEDHSLAFLRVNCRRLDMPEQDFQAVAAGLANFGKIHFSPIGLIPSQPIECPSGFWSVGIYGRSGAYVDYFGFICGKVPGPAPVIASTPAPPTRPRLQPRTKLPSRLDTGVRPICPSSTDRRQDENGKVVCVQP